jgi:bifunctional non-homologous end joining protein LigD
MGLEGLVSKRADSRYRGGRSPDWIKFKNRQHPALERVMEANVISFALVVRNGSARRA